MKQLLAAAILLGLGACSPQNSASPAAAGDMTMGAPASAAVTLIEYAAPSCPYCKQFHDEVYTAVKAKYIDTNKIHFIFREFPSHNPPVDIAVFQLARCAGKDKYFSVIDAAFAAQTEIERAAQTPTGAKPELVKIAQANGVSESRFETCIADQAGIKRIQDGVQEAVTKYDVHGTPTLILNGRTIDGNTEPDAYTLTGLSARLDAALAAPK
jgi:protein-disulfide isomerase